MDASGDVHGALALYQPVMEALERQSLPSHVVSTADLLTAATVAHVAKQDTTCGRWLALTLDLSDAEGDMHMHCTALLALLRLQMQGPQVEGAPLPHERPANANPILTADMWEQMDSCLEAWQRGALLIELGITIMGTPYQAR